ncbi:MAG: phytanoyl-CoA dioxygenase family protein [Planctomycetaceae bacterium]|nr:phytanoyl-CoA dioxygenase family protein [Planctomycetaceae bacterium]
MTAARDEFTVEEVAAFQRDGFVIARGLTDNETLARMRAATEDGLRRDIAPVEYEADLQYPGAPTSKEVAGGRTIRRLKQAASRGPVFLEWMTQPIILRRLQQLLGPKVVCPLAHHNCIMTKQPEFSSDTGWHQDIRYWSFQRPELINAWIALGEERTENGGLFVIPGSHRMNFSSHQFDEAKFYRSDLPENQAQIATKVAVELLPGDVLFFHCLTLHAATRNFTTAPKWSVVFTFRPADNTPMAGTRSAQSPELLLTPGI